MPRRYPRLNAKDRQGQPVSIPLCIAPRLLADEEFVSLPQRKVDEIAAANERVRTQELAASGLPKKPPSPRRVPADNESEYKADDENSSHENVGSSITGTASPERSSASSSQDRVGGTNAGVKHARKRRMRRLWTLQEDQVVLCAVLKNQTGPSLVGRLPNRSRSAVLKRFYVMKEKVKRDRRKRARHTSSNPPGSELDTDMEEKSGTNDGTQENDGMQVEKDGIDVIEVECNNNIDEDLDVDEDQLLEDQVSLDEYESYEEDADEEEQDDDDDIDATRSGIGDGYRPDEEMDVIPPL